jgi:ankyrin repeat protein
MWGEINGQYSVVTTLINAGAELDIPDDKNLTTLMRAAWSGHLSIVNQLIAAGADPNRRDNNGLSAIEYAKREGHKVIIASLKITIKWVSSTNPI